MLSSTDLDRTQSTGELPVTRLTSSNAKPQLESEESQWRERVDHLLDDVEKLSLSLSDKYEEVRLIHNLTSHLELDDDPSEICQELLQQLFVCVNCRSLIIELVNGEETTESHTYLSVGRAVDAESRDHILAQHGSSFDGVSKECIVVNQGRSAELLRRRVLVLPISRRNRNLGRLIAIRDLSDDDFGTIEADLIRSVLMVLSMHLFNQQQYSEMQSVLQGMVQSLALALDAKDAYTHGHSSRVAALAVELSKRLGMPDEAIESIYLAGLLHDIGKIGIDDAVLKKPGDLTREEFDQIKRHPVIGFDILKDVRPLRHILPAVRHHHESWDGRGYPDGLAGDAIPRDAQILAVADSFDAMVSDRPYRKGMNLDKVKSIFGNGSGKQWAADVVEVLLGADGLMESFAPGGVRCNDLADCRR